MHSKCKIFHLTLWNMLLSLNWLTDVTSQVCYPNGNSVMLSLSFLYNVHDKLITPGKNNLFRNSNAHANGLRHENGCVKSSSQLQGEHCKH